MASMYAGLKNKIPREPTVRDVAIAGAMKEREGRPFNELVTEHVALQIEAQALAAKVKDLSTKLAAVAALMEDGLTALDADSVTSGGFTWSISYEPYPSCEDPAAIVQYFNDHEMGDQLKLNKTELANRLKTFVKEEALANELVVTTKIVNDVEVQEVRSKIPGVKVFLKSSLSKAKAKVAK